MPFPWKRPTSIHCLPDDLIRIRDNIDGLIWLKIIAVKGADENDDLDIDFFALTKINNNELQNSTLPTEGPTCELVIPTSNSPNRTHYHYIHIPTTGPIISFENELAKYCSPLLDAGWALLDGFSNSQIFVLRPNILPLVSNKPLLAPSIPTIIFNFPILDTLEDRVELEEMALERHICHYAPCSEFFICPSTFFEPVNEPPLHKHCTDKTCVRFYEKIDINFSGVP